MDSLDSWKLHYEHINQNGDRNRIYSGPIVGKFRTIANFISRVRAVVGKN